MLKATGLGFRRMFAYVHVSSKGGVAPCRNRQTEGILCAGDPPSKLSDAGSIACFAEIQHTRLEHLTVGAYLSTHLLLHLLRA